MPIFKSKVATKERFAIRRNKSGNYAGKPVCFEPGGFGRSMVGGKVEEARL